MGMRRRRSKTKRYLWWKSLAQRIFFVAIPLLLLVWDLWSFPLFATRTGSRDANIVTLLSNRVLPVGTFNTHNVTLTFDSIQRKEFLDYISGSPNALVVTYFVTAEEDLDGSTPPIQAGELARALASKVAHVSPEAIRQYKEDVMRLIGRRAGDVIRFPIHAAAEHHFALPIDYVYVVMLNAGSGDQNEGLLLKALPKVFRAAAADNIASLVVPCLAYRWDDKKTVPLSEFFQPLAESLASSGPPRDVYVPLYTGWPTFALEDAMKCFNEAWHGVAWPQGFAAKFQINRAEDRLRWVFLSLCLLVSSFFAPLTLKNFVIISAAFIGVATGAVKTIESLTSGRGMILQVGAEIVALTMLAAGFPLFVNWNPKNVFDPEKKT